MQVLRTIRVITFKLGTFWKPRLDYIDCKSSYA